RLFESQPALEDKDFLAIAAELHLNAARVKNALSRQARKSDIEADMDLAEDVDARGTPQFYINGRRLSGAQPFEEFQKLIDEQLKKAQAVVAGGEESANVYDEIMKTD